MLVLYMFLILLAVLIAALTVAVIRTLDAPMGACFPPFLLPLPFPVFLLLCLCSPPRNLAFPI